jgi:cell division septum initiation protein DivIVA
MDILHLVDRLEELFNESRPIPLTHSVIVDEDRMLEIIDQMRISIPEEVKKAQQVLAQRDRVLAQAQEEANRTVKIAKEKGDEIISRDAIVDGAQGRAEQIIAQARADAEALRLEADDYIIEALGALEAELTRLLNQARNGIAKLNVEKQRFVEKAVDDPPEIEDQPQPSEEV